MVALIGVDMQLGGWRADIVHADDLDWIDRPPSHEKWLRWIAPAVEFQALRGGGIFIASAPI
jgi:hypothetical protein